MRGHDFSQQDDVLPSNEEKPTPLFSECVSRVYSLHCVLEDEVS
jgi:hypothetical protein